MSQVKNITIKVFPPAGSGHKPIRHVLRAPAKKIFTSKGVDGILADFAERIEKVYPGVDYKLVPLVGNNFNFVPVERSQEGGQLA